jgi:hypothetical protein
MCDCMKKRKERREKKYKVVEEIKMSAVGKDITKSPTSRIFFSSFFILFGKREIERERDEKPQAPKGSHQALPCFSPNKAGDLTLHHLPPYVYT